MNSIIVLLNAVASKDIKISIDTLHGNYRGYVYRIDNGKIYTSNHYINNPLLNAIYKGVIFDIKDITRVVIRATNVSKWKDVDKSVAESIPPTTLLSTLYYHHSISNKVYTHSYTKLYIFTDFIFSIYDDNINLHWNDISPE